MSPRTKEQNEAIREMRMRQIMQAAADVYLEKGIHMEVRDVAVKAELGYGTVYHYYKNKHMLLEDLLWSALSLAESAVLPAIEGNGNDMGRAELYSRLLFLKCIQDPSVFILLKTIADNFHQMPGNRFQKLMAVFQERLYLPLVEMIRQETAEQAPEKLANLIFGSIVGCATLHIHHRGQSGPDSLDVIDILFSGIRKRES
ncbi:TetR/AcrR family transcriptional regulator [Paenibacillus sp. sptzw28]|uniref:TetR/AcrR family transcriptional regulator n=1 Tax=Paenibacillus sp. sptzw28 TaxID=715179 RepID=UPI001C6F2B63|nr:TetR/AcrR family transcriptional regulator [Paenibacillus sp. sptzw28]QYR19323.1 TetR/AcrR family transcriptional regulator [Paenibacillus sp. sptzw28]